VLVNAPPFFFFRFVGVFFCPNDGGVFSVGCGWKNSGTPDPIITKLGRG